MTPSRTVNIPTDSGLKQISIYCGSILDFDEDIDILTTSAYHRSYRPTKGTMFNALDSVGISVMELAHMPMIDLRNMCNIWLSDPILKPLCHIHRIGCIELGHHDWCQSHDITNSIKAYFHMLDIASLSGVRMETIALPILGSGRQKYSPQTVIVPLMNECLSFLKRNHSVKRICFVEYNPDKARMIADYLKDSYQINFMYEDPGQPCSYTAPSGAQVSAFISYSSDDMDVAKALCARLESRGVRVWYAPRDVIGPYAKAITTALRKSTHFITLLSRNSMESQNVLNEVDFACQKLMPNIKIKPIRIDLTPLSDAFSYYLAIHHWMDATRAPLDARLDEFVDKFMMDL